MTTAIPPAGPSPKQTMLETSLRTQIVGGELKPGDRLPIWDELERIYSVSRTTVTRAIESLRNDGFVVGSRRRGTRVTDFPPHLYQYGIVYPSHPSRHPGWSEFWERMRQTAESAATPQFPRFRHYYDISPLRADAQEVERLNGDAQRQSLAGIVFFHSPVSLYKSGVLKTGNVPRVAISSLPTSPEIPIVYPDMASFDRRAVSELARQGRKKVAVLFTGMDSPDDQAVGDMAKLIKEYGLQSRPELMLSIPYWHVNWGKHYVQLLLSLEKNIRPDALVIHDDNLVVPALAGIEACGVKMPEDISVVAHCNYPAKQPSRPGLLRLGFDMNRLLTTSLDYLTRMRNHHNVPPLTLLPAVFEHELKK
jgi:GntR family transcriptional regulator of arabinose operon